MNKWKTAFWICLVLLLIVISILLYNNIDFTKYDNYLNVLSSLLTPVIAVIAVWIGYQQMKTHRYKIRIDLFERRLRIFDIIRKSLVIIMRDGSSKNIDWKEFGFAVQQSKFLLNNDLQSYIEEIDKKASELFRKERLLYGPGSLKVGEKRSKVCEENSQLLTWLVEQFEPLEENFSDFMKINKI